MHRNVLTIIAIHHPETNTTFLTVVCKEVSGKDEIVDTDVYLSRSAEIMWEVGHDISVRAAALKAIEKWAQRSQLDSPI